LTITLESYSQPPLVTLPWSPPRLTVAQLQAAVAGTFAAGSLSDDDAKSLAARTAALPGLHQQLGLYPVGSQTPAQQP
jgi:hypothetical protein